ncbi:phototropic-responsive NPH3 family protein [Actinidia rufa]|uniref:Phototropic-responsive NPH3 family protein n=1 Tax=Actinidia rufa TaxID=165716 RepID=A0A7J0DUX9_9ERIC|nr:phototropic-responsive NPH3 family protein [Actinidia rufa]
MAVAHPPPPSVDPTKPLLSRRRLKSSRQWKFLGGAARRSGLALLLLAAASRSVLRECTLPRRAFGSPLVYRVVLHGTRPTTGVTAE